MATLGGMLLSKEAITDVIDVLRGPEFYRSAHESIFDAIVEVYNRSEPADPLIVADELSRRGELERIGGAPYLATLMATVPTAANAGYYARIVKDKALMRGLVQAGTRITSWGTPPTPATSPSSSRSPRRRSTRWPTTRGRRRTTSPSPSSWARPTWRSRPPRTATTGR